MDEDKRTEPRFSYTEPVTYALPELELDGGIAGNISLSGLSLRVQGFVPMGANLELQISLGQSPQIIWAKAQVVRIREVLSEDCYEIGLKFVQDENIKKAIGEYINTSRSETTNQKELESYG